MLLIKEEYLTHLFFPLKVCSSAKLYCWPDKHIEWPAAMAGEELLLTQCHTLCSEELACVRCLRMFDRAAGISNHMADGLLIFCRWCTSSWYHIAVSMPSARWVAPAFLPCGRSVSWSHLVREQDLTRAPVFSVLSSMAVVLFSLCCRGALAMEKGF